MIKTTLCYIEKDNKYLMLLRNKKKNDLNEGKWIGVGGKFLPNETPDSCVLRETFEETGLKLTSFKQRGLIHFISDKWEAEEMYLYTADSFTGNLIDCNEGELAWIDKDKVFDLNLWEGDRIFLKKLIDGENNIELTVKYVGDKLVK